MNWKKFKTIVMRYMQLILINTLYVSTIRCKKLAIFISDKKKWNKTFCQAKSRVTLYRPESTVPSILHLMVLICLMFIKHFFKMTKKPDTRAKKWAGKLSALALQKMNRKNISSQRFADHTELIEKVIICNKKRIFQYDSETEWQYMHWKTPHLQGLEKLEWAIPNWRHRTHISEQVLFNMNILSMMH